MPEKITYINKIYPCPDHMDSCSTFVPEYFCENIHVPNRQRTADCSRYYALFGAKLLWWVMPVTELAVALKLYKIK